MRKILRKLIKEEGLTSSESENLLIYIDKLRSSSPESYYVFFDNYAQLLYVNYNILLSKYTWDIDNLINHFISHPTLYENNKLIPLTSFPVEARPYLKDMQKGDYALMPSYLTTILTPDIINELPSPRVHDIIIKYEAANPYKETGLKYHFERLAKYQFITRLQTYRYLSRNKAAFDRFEVVGPDCLGGIFTNKEKSIYYYLFLTEANLSKANNAAQLLNYAIYGKIEGT
ncbi:MAG: hypothetical protein GX333_06365 [Syntrophomonadaceae bacterium]|nr:hypothetical protein [Syntrophomonadaceae bacterium]